MKSITYKDSGVDIKKADNLLDDIKTKIHATFTPHVLNNIGAFAALTEVPKEYENPVMVSSTDGVGTKLKIAFMSGKHSTVGIDLVGMSVNDILTLGARPLFFLDYYASGRIEDRVYKEVIAGICDGCLMAGCALIGGETAEMPSFYQDGEYDLAGFAVGMVEKNKIIDGSSINKGDVLIGLPSNGLHSNGYSLVRKVLFDVHRLDIHAKWEGADTPLYEELLRPTRIYVKPVLEVLTHFKVKGMVHITGGGLPGNIKRVIPQGLTAAIRVSRDSIPRIFRFIMKLGNIEFQEMCSTFNMGCGYVLVMGEDEAESTIAHFNKLGEQAYLLGRIEQSRDGDRVRIID